MLCERAYVQANASMLFTFAKCHFLSLNLYEQINGPLWGRLQYHAPLKHYISRCVIHLLFIASTLSPFQKQKCDTEIYFLFRERHFHIFSSCVLEPLMWLPSKNAPQPTSSCSVQNFITFWNLKMYVHRNVVWSYSALAILLCKITMFQSVGVPSL